MDGTEPFLTGVSGGSVLSISSGVTAGPKLTWGRGKVRYTTASGHLQDIYRTL